MTKRSLFIGAVSVLVLATCAKPGSTPKQAEEGANPLPIAKSANVAPISVATADGKLATTGSLAIEVSPSYAKGSIRGYLVGFEGKYILRADGGEEGGPWKFKISAVPPATYELLITGLTLPTTEAPQGESVGIRIGDIAIPTSGVRKLSVEKLEKGATAKGKAILLGEDLHTAVTVRIPGTHFHAETDAEGNYEISDVPLGKYSLEFVREGYHSGMISEVLLLEASIKEMDPITLVRPDFEGAGFTVVQKDGVVKGKDVTLIMVPPTDAAFMRLAELPNLKEVPWQPLVTTVVHSFDTLGEKNLYVQFSNKDKDKPSSIYANSFTLASPE